jgi:hypothetical protein
MILFLGRKALFTDVITNAQEPWRLTTPGDRCEQERQRQVQKTGRNVYSCRKCELDRAGRRGVQVLLPIALAPAVLPRSKGRQSQVPGWLLLI